MILHKGEEGIHCRSKLTSALTDDTHALNIQYANVERVASENSIRQISGFLLLMFLLILTFMSRLFSLVLNYAYACACAYGLVKTSLKDAHLF